MEVVVHSMWQIALMIIAICVILFFIPIAIKMLRITIKGLFMSGENNKEE